MRTWKIVTATLAVTVLVAGAGAAGLIYSGAYDVAATSKHWPVTRWALSKTVHRSVARQARDIDAPALGDENQLLAGAANFEAMCSDCHAPPGSQPSVAARGMYPAPPELTHAAREKSPAEIFWVIKHGIKASGMPAWGVSHDDEEIWAMTAFVEQLPDMSAADYRQMLRTAEARDIGHGHDGHPQQSHGHHGKGHMQDPPHHDHGHDDSPAHESGHDAHADNAGAHTHS